jgi:hypothetical protein
MRKIVILVKFLAIIRILKCKTYGYYDLYIEKRILKIRIWNFYHWLSMADFAEDMQKLSNTKKPDLCHEETQYRSRH